MLFVINVKQLNIFTSVWMKTPEVKIDSMKANTKLFIVLCSILLLNFSIGKTQERIDKIATIRAKIMASVSLLENEKEAYDSLLNTDIVKKHYAQFNQSWQKLDEEHLSKMRIWRDTELKKFQKKKGRTLFYPFSGPDFLNAYNLFPNCENYLLFGLEPNGKLIDLQNMPPNYLPSLRQAFAEMFQRNYFVTSYMSADLWGKGVLPIINIYLARTGNSIVGIKRFYLNKDGKAIFFALKDEKAHKDKLTGITIEFIHKDKKKTQHLYYFSQDVEDRQIAKLPELTKFIQSFERKITMIKAASYILHHHNFATMKKLVLESDVILQDDTGVRYKALKEANWKVKLYGKYARPVADFGSYAFQADLQQVFEEQRNKIQSLSFSYGYHWKSDNTILLLCTKKR